MKKLLLIAATSTALLSSVSALACDGCEPEVKVMPVATVTTITTENQFYGKIEGGVTFLDRAKDTFFKVKMKGRPAGVFGVGAGYYVMDNFRTDLTFHMLANPAFKKSFDRNGNALSVKHKGKVLSVLLNGYVDLFDLNGAKIFAGAGLGWAQVKEKIILQSPGHAPVSKSSKVKNNLAYQLSLGGSVDLNETVKGDLSYSWRDFGKTKKILEGGRENGKTPYRTHNITLGLRFSM